MPRQFEIVIKGARIVDGTGNPYYRADIGLSNGRISVIQEKIEEESAERTIQTDELVVCPGFIDAHSHDDLYLLIRPSGEEKVRQGVTTTVIGNCGFSAAPMSQETRTDLIDAFSFAGSELIPEERWKWKFFGDFLRELETAQPGMNIVPLVGHSTIRIAAMGSSSRVPTDSEMVKMKALVAEAMEEGAFGLSTGLGYAPGNYASTEEIIEICRVVADYGGIYASHIRNESGLVVDSLAEAIRVGKGAGLPVQVSHHKVGGKNNWGLSIDTLAMIGRARTQGVEVTCDQYPYHVSSTYLAAVLPPHILADGPDVYCQKLRDPKVRERLLGELENAKGDWENITKSVGFENIIISSSPKHPEYIGQSLSDISAAERKTPYEVVFDLVAEEGRRTNMLVHSMAEEDIRRIMRSPFTMVASDGLPDFGVSLVHPRFTGTFPRVLGRYVREDGVLSLEEAVRKMTSLPAQTFRLNRKGLLKEEFDADIVIFDPDRIIDQATFEEPRKPPVGIHYVIIGGQIALENGDVTGEVRGRVIRKGG